MDKLYRAILLHSAVLSTLYSCLSSFEISCYVSSYRTNATYSLNRSPVYYRADRTRSSWREPTQGLESKGQS